MEGYLYVLTNPAIPGLVKIGRTERDPAARAAEISTGTGVPANFVVSYVEPVRDCYEAEKLIHDRLANCRVNTGREFFRLSVNSAVEEIRSTCRHLLTIDQLVGVCGRCKRTVRTVRDSRLTGVFCPDGHAVPYAQMQPDLPPQPPTLPPPPSTTARIVEEPLIILTDAWHRVPEDL